ncbi:MAG: hypothetical protein GXP29_11655 [Planctomycetes bacterium]|nr:hypothetical protein [Planctomycetota bacterium]
MAKRYDILEDSLEDWLRIGETAVWVYGLLVLLAGLGFVIAKCAVAEFGTAFVGLVATMSGVVLTVLCSGAIRMVRRVNNDRGRLLRLKRRIEELELEFETDSGETRIVRGFDDVAVPQDGSGTDASGTPSRLAEGDDEHRFREALDAGNLETCRELWPLLKLSFAPDRIEALQADLDKLDRRTSESLRQSFAVQLRTEDYRAALDTGESIVKLFPKSRMSADFQAIRERLEHKASLKPGEENGEGATS